MQFLGLESSINDRSDSMNPNNSAYQDEIDNETNQQNPNNDHYDENYGSN